MNLTVAMKIIGGFAIISLLLVVTSVISLSNLNNINTATLKQSELAVPTLSGSNKLANTLVQTGNLTLKGYYQTELPPLADNLSSFNQLTSSFDKDLRSLKSVVKSEKQLLNNLNKVDSVYTALQSDINSVFENRKISIEQLSILVEKIDLLEEKADDAATLMLDLADHDLADS